MVKNGPWVHIGGPKRVQKGAKKGPKRGRFTEEIVLKIAQLALKGVQKRAYIVQKRSKKGPKSSKIGRFTEENVLNLEQSLM